MLNPKEHVLDWLDDYLHEVLSPEDADVVRQHCDECKVCSAGLEEAQKRFDAMKSIPPSEAGEDLVTRTVEKVEMNMTRQNRNWWIVNRVALSVTAAAVLIIGGLHIYFASMQPSSYDLRLLGQNQLLSGTMASMRVDVVHQHTGERVSNIPVEITLRDLANNTKVTLASFSTGDDVANRQSFELPEWNDGKYQLQITAKTGWRPETLVQDVHLKRSWKLMLSSDKPLYQPGQTIHLRALALRRPDLKPVAGEQVVFSISDPKGNVIFKQSDVTSKFGNTSTDCALASEIIEGPYNIECRVGGVTSRRTVKVEKYVLPKFRVAIKFEKPFYAPGDQVSGTVKSQYFFGKPVAGGELKVDVRAAGFSQQPITTIDEKLNDDGEFKFQFVLPGRMFGREQDAGNARFRLIAQVTDTAGQTQSTGTSRVVTAQPIRLEVIPESGTLVQDMTNTVYVYANYADGRPAKVRLVVHGIDHEIETNALGVAAFELTPEEPNVGLTIKATDATGRIGRKHVDLACGNVAGDFLVRTDRAVYDGGETISLTALGRGIEPVFIDLIKDGQTMVTQTVDMADGKGDLQIDLPAEVFGTLRLEAYRFGKGGLAVRKSRMLFVRQARELNITASLDEKSYRPGETAKLKFKLTDGDGKPVPGAISLAAVDEAVYAVLNQSANMETVFFLLEQDLLKPVYAIYSGWEPDLPMAGDLPLAERDQFNQALFSRTAAATTGNDAVPIDFNDTRTFGATFAEPAVDAAVTEMVVIEEANLDPFAMDGANNQVVTPVGFESPYSLAAHSFPGKAASVRRTKRNGIQGAFIAWISLAGSLVLFGVVVFAVARPRAFFITSAVGGVLILIVVPCFALVAVSAVVVKEAATGEAPNADMMWAAGAEAAGDTEWDGAMEGAGFDSEDPSDQKVESDGPAPPRLRQWFPETLLWKPELLTDENGEATLDLALADSITEWRLSASAVSGDGRLGSIQRPIKVFQPFFVDFNLPVALTRGDEVGVPVVVYNYLDKPQTVELELAAADWFTLLGDDPSTKRTLELKAGEVRSIQFPLAVKDVGLHNLKITALASGMNDAVQRQIEVIPNGRRIEEVASGRLDKPFEMTLDAPDNIVPGSVRAIVKLHPSTFSQLVEGLDSIFRMPSGCFEQTSSTTYPNVLALDYLRRTGRSAEKIEAKARQYIHVGYQRLLSFEINGGGFDWFGNPPANMLLSAYGLMEFEDMARVHDVDPRLIERTRGWLLSRRQADGSWNAAKDALHDDWAGSWQDRASNLGPTAFIAMSVFASDKAKSQASATLDYLLAARPDSINNPYVLALVINAIATIDSQHSELSKYVSQLKSLKKTDQDGRVWWEQPADGRTAFYGSGNSGNIETTAMAAIAMMKSGANHAAVRGALTWLIEQKDANGTWHSTQSTVLALKALLMGTDKPLGEEKPRKIEIALGGEVIRTIEISKEQADVMQQIDLSDQITSAGAYRLSITEKTDMATGYQVTFRYHVEDQSTEEPDEPLSIDVVYDRQRLNVDETITAVASVTNNMQQPAPMVILDLPIPGGFKIEPGELDELKGSGKIAKYQITARKAIVYLRGLAPGSQLKLNYRLKATMPVKVAVPPAQAYEYYNPKKRGSGGATNLEAIEA